MANGAVKMKMKSLLQAIQREDLRSRVWSMLERMVRGFVWGPTIGLSTFLLSKYKLLVFVDNFTNITDYQKRKRKK